jgi:hypothetical protein
VCPRAKVQRKSRISARRLMSAEELLALDLALIEAYASHRALCEVHPVAIGQISRPAIPSAFSESLTALLAAAFYGEGSSAAFGGTASDLVIVSPRGASCSVEVKASGVSRFQELKDRDLAADALVWVDFGARYVLSSGPVTFHHLPQPRRFRAPRRKLTLDVFLRAVGELYGFQSILVTDLRGLLREGSSEAIKIAAPQLRLVVSGEPAQ